MDQTQVMDFTQIIPEDWTDEEKMVGWLKIDDEKHKLIQGVTKIGRSEIDCQISLPDKKTLSGIHACIDVDECGTVTIMDMGSRNKTRIGKMVLKASVRYGLLGGEEIIFGDVVARYEVNSQAAVASDPEDNDSTLDITPAFKLKGWNESYSDASIISPTPQCAGSSTTLRTTPQTTSLLWKTSKTVIPDTPSLSSPLNQGGSKTSVTCIEESPSASQSTPAVHKQDAKLFPKPLVSPINGTGTRTNTSHNGSFLAPMQITGTKPIKTTGIIEPEKIDYDSDSSTDVEDFNYNDDSSRNEEGKNKTQSENDDSIYSMATQAFPAFGIGGSGTGKQQDENIDDTQDIMKAFGEESADVSGDNTQEVLDAFDQPTQAFTDDSLVQAETQTFLKPNFIPSLTPKKVKLIRRGAIPNVKEDIFNCATQVFEASPMKMSPKRNNVPNKSDDFYDCVTQAFDDSITSSDRNTTPKSKENEFNTSNVSSSTDDDIYNRPTQAFESPSPVKPTIGVMRKKQKSRESSSSDDDDMFICETQVFEPVDTGGVKVEPETPTRINQFKNNDADVKAQCSSPRKEFPTSTKVEQSPNLNESLAPTQIFSPSQHTSGKIHPKTMINTSKGFLFNESLDATQLFEPSAVALNQSSFKEMSKINTDDQISTFSSPSKSGASEHSEFESDTDDELNETLIDAVVEAEQQLERESSLESAQSGIKIVPDKSKERLNPNDKTGDKDDSKIKDTDLKEKHVVGSDSETDEEDYLETTRISKNQIENEKVCGSDSETDCEDDKENNENIKSGNTVPNKENLLKDTFVANSVNICSGVTVSSNTTNVEDECSNSSDTLLNSEVIIGSDATTSKNNDVPNKDKIYAGSDSETDCEDNNEVKRDKLGVHFDSETDCEDNNEVKKVKMAVQSDSETDCEDDNELKKDNLTAHSDRETDCEDVNTELEKDKMAEDDKTTVSRHIKADKNVSRKEEISVGSDSETDCEDTIIETKKHKTNESNDTKSIDKDKSESKGKMNVGSDSETDCEDNIANKNTKSVLPTNIKSNKKINNKEAEKALHLGKTLTETEYLNSDSDTDCSESLYQINNDKIRSKTIGKTENTVIDKSNKKYSNETNMEFHKKDGNTSIKDDFNPNNSSMLSTLQLTFDSEKDGSLGDEIVKESNEVAKTTLSILNNENKESTQSSLQEKYPNVEEKIIVNKESLVETLETTILRTSLEVPITDGDLELSSEPKKTPVNISPKLKHREDEDTPYMSYDVFADVYAGKYTETQSDYSLSPTKSHQSESPIASLIDSDSDNETEGIAAGKSQIFFDLNEISDEESQENEESGTSCRIDEAIPQESDLKDITFDKSRKQSQTIKMNNTESESQERGMEGKDKVENISESKSQKKPETLSNNQNQTASLDKNKIASEKEQLEDMIEDSESIPRSSRGKRAKIYENSKKENVEGQLKNTRGRKGKIFENESVEEQWKHKNEDNTSIAKNPRGRKAKTPLENKEITKPSVRSSSCKQATSEQSFQTSTSESCGATRNMASDSSQSQERDDPKEVPVLKRPINKIKSKKMKPKEDEEEENSPPIAIGRQTRDRRTIIPPQKFTPSKPSTKWSTNLKRKSVISDDMEKSSPKKILKVDHSPGNIKENEPVLGKVSTHSEKEAKTRLPGRSARGRASQKIDEESDKASVNNKDKIDSCSSVESKQVTTSSKPVKTSSKRDESLPKLNKIDSKGNENSRQARKSSKRGDTSTKSVENSSQILDDSSKVLENSSNLGETSKNINEINTKQDNIKKTLSPDLNTVNSRPKRSIVHKFIYSSSDSQEESISPLPSPVKTLSRSSNPSKTKENKPAEKTTASKSKTEHDVNSSKIERSSRLPTQRNAGKLETTIPNSGATRRSSVVLNGNSETDAVKSSTKINLTKQTKSTAKSNKSPMKQTESTTKVTKPIEISLNRHPKWKVPIMEEKSLNEEKTEKPDKKSKQNEVISKPDTSTKHTTNERRPKRSVVHKFINVSEKSSDIEEANANSQDKLSVKIKSGPLPTETSARKARGQIEPISANAGGESPNKNKKTAHSLPLSKLVNIKSEAKNAAIPKRQSRSTVRNIIKEEPLDDILSPAKKPRLDLESSRPKRNDAGFGKEKKAVPTKNSSAYSKISVNLVKMSVADSTVPESSANMRKSPPRKKESPPRKAQSPLRKAKSPPRRRQTRPGLTDKIEEAPTEKTGAESPQSTSEADFKLPRNKRSLKLSSISPADLSSRKKRGRPSTKIESANISFDSDDASSNNSAVMDEKSTKNSRKRKTEALPSPSKSIRSSRSSIASHHSLSDIILWSTSDRQSAASVKPKVAFTGYIDANDEKIIKSTGGTVVDSALESNVVVTTSVRRTCKLLVALGRGLPIVSPKWVVDTKRAHNFVDPWQYIIVDSDAESKFCFNLKKSLEISRKKQLLSGYSIHATPNVKPPPDQMKEIIESAGASYLDMPPKRNLPNIVVVSCVEDKKSWLAFKKVKLDVVSTEFVLTGLLRQQILIKEFALG